MRINSKEKEDIIEYYKNTLSIKKTSELFKRKPDTISKLLERCNIKEYNKKIIKTSCNEDYFESIDTEDKAYFLGLLMADGCNTKKNITISSIDIDILYKFKEFSSFTGKIYKYQPKEEATAKKLFGVMMIPSIKWCNDLSKLGVVPNKTHKTYFPTIPKNLERHFIRGVFDGDGCIGLYKTGNHFSILGNDLLINSINNIFYEECNVTKKELYYSNSKNKNIVYLQYNRKKDLIKILNFLYKDSTIYLDRKFKKAVEIINIK